MNPKQKTVFLATRFETKSGKDEVVWAYDGDLDTARVLFSENPTSFYGLRQFRTESDALDFAKQQGLKMGEGTVIHCHLVNGPRQFFIKDRKVIDADTMNGKNIIGKSESCLLVFF